MTEVVIVSIARSPVGRANKGSLASLRPDGLAAQMTKGALDQLPALDPAEIDDLILGCAMPGGEQCFNMTRAVAVQRGFGHLPGTTVTRYCASSLQTTRMAMHAVKAGEAHVCVLAGVESVTSFRNGNSDNLPGTENPLFQSAQARSARAAQGGVSWCDPRETGELPDIYIAMG